VLDVVVVVVVVVGVDGGGAAGRVVEVGAARLAGVL